jgi:GTP-binding protein
LFLIAADAKDIREEYNTLLNELRKYNPELLDKRRLLAISKADLLDDELLVEMKKEVPSEIPSVFISSVTNNGIKELKDLIWQTLHKKSV